MLDIFIVPSVLYTHGYIKKHAKGSIMGALFSNGWGRPALQAWTVVHFEGLILGGVIVKYLFVFDGTNWPAITGGACLVSVSF